MVISPTLPHNLARVPREERKVSKKNKGCSPRNQAQFGISFPTVTASLGFQTVTQSQNITPDFGNGFPNSHHSITTFATRLSKQSPYRANKVDVPSICEFFIIQNILSNVRCLSRNRCRCSAMGGYMPFFLASKAFPID